MSTTAAPASNAAPYPGPLHLEVGQPLLPSRYADCEDWRRVAQAVAQDFLRLRTTHPEAFFRIARHVAHLVGGAR